VEYAVRDQSLDGDAGTRNRKTCPTPMKNRLGMITSASAAAGTRVIPRQSSVLRSP